MLISFVVLCGNFIYEIYAGNDIDIIKTESSPDGKYIAYLFEQNSGATSDFIYNLSILKKEEKLKSRYGNVCRSHNTFDFKWISNSNLKVVNHNGDDYIRQKEKINKIAISYD